VFKFFEEQGLTVEKLRELSQQQVGMLATGLGFDPEVSINAIAGFSPSRAPRRPSCTMP
jgi:hypothetical protein